MAVSTVKSLNITNIEATPRTLLHKKNGMLCSNVDRIAVATTSIDEIGDIILLNAIPSNAVLVDLLFLCDDLDSNGSPLLAADVGLYYSGTGNQTYLGKPSGTVIDADCFGTAVTTFRAAVTSWTSLRFEVDDIVDVEKELWEVAGLTSDPGGFFYVGLTITAAAATAAAGDVVCRAEYYVI
jgi:hypothetical protein